MKDIHFMSVNCRFIWCMIMAVLFPTKTKMQNVVV